MKRLAIAPVFALVALAGVFSGCYAHAHHHHAVVVGATGGVMVAAPPPVAQVEVVEPAPSVSVVWVPGYWHWGGAAYVWVPGTYVDARPGYYWVAPSYRYHGGSYVYLHGYWAPHRHYYGPRYYGHSYSGGHRYYRSGHRRGGHWR